MPSAERVENRGDSQSLHAATDDGRTSSQRQSKSFMTNVERNGVKTPQHQSTTVLNRIVMSTVPASVLFRRESPASLDLQPRIAATCATVRRCRHVLLLALTPCV